MSAVLDSSAEQFGPYEVFERLGMGGMAMVHRAKKRGPEGFEQNVALKRMLQHLAEDQSFVESFVREAKVASLLVHPNIAQVYDFGRIRGVYYIAMELVAGFDVRKLLRYANRSNEPIPLPVILSILGEMCDALDFAHNFIDEQGARLDIVHRDVSPSNLIVAHTGHLKVIDFGIAKASSRQLHTESGKVKGKLGYMSPEAALGMNSGAVSDLFSAGVVAWELVTALPLFTTRTDMETMQRIREARIKPPSVHNPACPPELDALILSALEREPERRISSASVFRGGLDDIIARYGVAVSARAVVEWMMRFAQPEDAWARNSERNRSPTGRQVEQPTSVIRGSSRPRVPDQRMRPPSRPPALHRSPEQLALATEIWGEDQGTSKPETGPDFSIADLRASTPVPMPNLPVTRELGPERQTVPPPMRSGAIRSPLDVNTQIPSLAPADARITELPLRGRPSTPPSSVPILPQSAPLVVPTLPPAITLPEPAEPKRSRWPIAVLALLAIVAGVLVAILATRGGSDDKVAVTAPDASVQITAIQPDARDNAIEPDAAEAKIETPDAAVENRPKPPINRPRPPRGDAGSGARIRPGGDRPKPPDPIVEQPKPPDPKPSIIEPPKPPDPKPPARDQIVEPPKPPKPTRTPVVSPSAVTKLSGEIPPVRANTTEDTVTVKICIDESGHVTGVTGKVSGDVLGELQRGLASWRYKPYVKDGKASAVCFPLSLRLVKR